MVVSTRNLVLEYRLGAETLRVLDIPSWDLGDGEQVAISGPSGSGKSTLLNLVAGLALLTSGSLVVCDHDVTRLSEAERDRFRAAHLAYIFQTFNLLQGYTAIENVLLGATFGPARADRATAKALLERVGLGGRLRHTPAEMSIGEQQRVAIARALIKKPKLILADEPTGSLDPRRAAVVVTLLRDACHERGCALVVVSHEAGVVSAFERKADFKSLNRTLTVTGGTP